MRLTFPTFLTFVRLALTPLLVIALARHEFTGAVVVLAVALLSDLLDGHLARRWQQESLLGASLDPLADKILIISCYITLILSPSTRLTLPLWFLAVVLTKELVLLAGAAYFGLIKKQLAVKPLLMGKLSMVAQSFLVTWLVACALFQWQPQRTLNSFIAIALALVIASLAQYALYVFRKQRSSL